MLLRELKAANLEWFSRGNKRFFGDVSYRVLHSKVTGEPYLVRSTYAWTDMNGEPKKLHYRINPIGDMDNPFSIRPLVGGQFHDIWAVKRWLKSN